MYVKISSLVQHKKYVCRNYAKIQTFIYSIVSIESMATTISISEGVKEELKNLGRTGDSYEDVIKKMLALTRKQMLMSYLYDISDSITIKEARKLLHG